MGCPLVIKDSRPERRRSAVRGRPGGGGVHHGGRQLDGVRSAISALPLIADAVGDDLELYLDSGIRSGLDVLKALALGARPASSVARGVRRWARAAKPQSPRCSARCVPNSRWRWY